MYTIPHPNAPPNDTECPCCYNALHCLSDAEQRIAALEADLKELGDEWTLDAKGYESRLKTARTEALWEARHYLKQLRTSLPYGYTDGIKTCVEELDRLIAEAQSPQTGEQEGGG